MTTKRRSFASTTPPHTVPVLCKALRVFETVAKSAGGVTTKELAVSLNISHTTCYRILQSFVAQGWLSARRGGTYELSFALVPLLRPLLHHELLIETVKEPLQQLAVTTGLTAKLTVRQGDDAVTLVSAASPKSTAITSRVGSVVSLAIGSSGAALLSALPDAEVALILDQAAPEVWSLQDRADVQRRIREARKDGVCFDHGSFQPHLHTLSSPLVVPARGIVAAITLLGFPQDFEGTAKATLTRHLKFTAGGCLQLINGQDIAA
jgi:DNA-binding IclR family transcriptional regulator